MIPENHYAARKLTHDDRTFVFVDSHSFLVETTGEILPRKKLADWLCNWFGDRPPVIATNNSAALVKELDDKLSGFPNWTWRATPLRKVKRSAVKPNDTKPAVSVKLHPHYCGFKRTNGKQRNRYFYFADCVNLTGNTSDALYPNLRNDESLRVWATAYRQFCNDHGTPMVSTRGKFGSAMLRDPRYIGSSNRRIPAFINNAARGHLPGNHYSLRAPVNEITNGLYLDITNAHHNAAERTQFPDPSGLRARGFYTDAEDFSPIKRAWAERGTRKFAALQRTHGLVLLRASYRGTSKAALLHPAAERATTNRPNWFYAFTNEIPLLEQSGFSIDGFEAAFTSGRTHDGLNRYATDAQRYLANTSPENKSWMKLMFLSTYGMLGKTPSAYQSVSNMGGKSITWPTSSGWIEGGLKGTQREHSPATTNVIALGMIQAETRRNVIETAQYLESMGVKVLALYADSLIVKADAQLPFLPPEWRIKSELTNLRFINAVTWIADQDERMPGIGRETALRESRRRAIRARARVTYGTHGEESRPYDPPEWLLRQAEKAGV